MTAMLRLPWCIRVTYRASVLSEVHDGLLGFFAEWAGHLEKEFNVPDSRREEEDKGRRRA